MLEGNCDKGFPRRRLWWREISHQQVVFDKNGIVIGLFYGHPLVLLEKEVEEQKKK